MRLLRAWQQQGAASAASVCVATRNTELRRSPRGKFARLKTRDVPTFAIAATHKTVRVFDVAELQLCRVPLERGLWESHGHTPEQNGLGQRTGVVEICGRRRARKT